jgi:hypothetical protein
MATLRAEMDADKLEPEERAFALEKWKMLARNVADTNFTMTDDDKQSALREMQELENLLDPRKRGQRAPGATSPSSTIPNDDYFTP